MKSQSIAKRQSIPKEVPINTSVSYRLESTSDYLQFKIIKKITGINRKKVAFYSFDIRQKNYSSL